MTEIKHSVQIQVQFHDAYICKILPGVSLVFKLLPWLSQVLSKQGRRIAEHSSYQAGIHQVSCVVDRTNNTNRTADAVTQHLESSCSAPSKLRLLLFNLAGFIYFFLVPTSNWRLDVQSKLNILDEEFKKSSELSVKLFRRERTGSRGATATEFQTEQVWHAQSEDSSVNDLWPLHW